VSSNINVVSVVGIITSANIDELNVSVSLSAGGNQIDFDQVIVKYINDSATMTLGGEGTDFDFYKERNVSLTSSKVLATGDMGIITISGVNLEARGRGTIQIIPEAGVMVVKDVIAPASFGTNKQVQLFP
jgi:archaellin